ncbi:hypothetical protein [Patulibacter defluvii]|uniref:hypothetical protein n=1 Tax=Patulibacter defluvii TaxID=3095358 RepID=UPI002A76081F|nr:hypothetical protein [Patulibacter sp. DM4]
MASPRLPLSARRRMLLATAGATLLATAAAAPAGAASLPGVAGPPAFTLTPQGGKTGILRDLGKRLPRASVGAVLASANRATGPVGGALSPRPAGFQNGFRFNRGDDGTSKWFPQGISGTGDATPSGLVDGRRALLVSWYARNPVTKSGTVAPGVRVTFATAEKLAASRYRHVLLVVPKRVGGRASFTWTPSHAGGIAWVGNRLYVAETNGGLSVYGTRRIWRVKTGDKARIGCDAGACQAADYQYVMPKVAAYRNNTSGLRFSSVAYDRASNNLVTGEYRKADEGNARIVRWPLNANGTLQAIGPKGKRLVRASGVWVAQGVPKIQGVLTIGTTAYLSTSGDGHGLYVGPLGGALAKRTWPTGAEDLTYAPASGRIYSLTEPEGRRAVFGVSR